MYEMGVDQELCRKDYSPSYIDKISSSYSNDKMKEEDNDELNSSLNSNCFFSSGSTCFDNILFNCNVVKSINEEVNSVRPFIESIKMDEYKSEEDHVVPRRSIFQMVIQRSKPSFQNKNRFYSKEGSLLNSIQWKKLLNWNLKSLNDEWHLLYKGSRDGFNAKDFHRLCDNQGPTITEKFLDFVNDPNAFLFSFSSNCSIKYSLIDRNSKYAVWNAPNYGPTFGRGADLFVCSQSDIVEESYSKLPSSYRDPTGLAEKALAGQQQFLIHDIEVYH